MPRHKKPKPKLRRLCPCVYWKHGAWRLVKKNKWTTLGKTEAEAYRALAELATGSRDRADTMNALFDRFVRDVVPQKSPRTQQLYTAYIARLRPVFGAMAPGDIEMADAYAYLDLRGKISKGEANMEISALSMVLTLAAGRWGVLKANPLRGIKKLKTPARDRHVTDAEFWAVHDRAPPIVRAAMLLAVSTGLRLGDLLSLRQEQFDEDGLHVTPAKTRNTSGKKFTIEWSDDLAKALHAAIYAPRETESAEWVLAYTNGRKYNQGTFSHDFHRAVKQAVADGAMNEGFHFHDLRAKAADLADNAPELLGHANPATTKRHYLRAPAKVKPARRPDRS